MEKEGRKDKPAACLSLRKTVETNKPKTLDQDVWFALLCLILSLSLAGQLVCG